LFGWEEELLEGCCAMFYDIVLQHNVFDRWFWRTARSEKNLCQESLFVFDKSRGGEEEVIEEGKSMWFVSKVFFRIRDII
jgi:hypothetical protein